MSPKTAIFGLGYFGRFHLKNISSLGYLGYGIDTDPEKKKLVEELGGEFLCADLTKVITIKRDKKGNPIGHEIRKDLPEIKELAKNTKFWDIVTPTFSHFPLMLLGLELGKDIFVEKPPTERVSEIEYILKKFPRAKIGVDYLEIVHPVVLAIKDVMVKEKFRPVYFFHHRSKDLRGTKKVGLPVILDELVHDLSEIDVFRKFVSKKPFAKFFPKVKKVWLQTWQELAGNYPYSSDAKAKFSLIFKDKVTADIKGSFADPEVRQFLIIGKDRKTAFYGNTLTRKIISPIAAKIVGNKNIEYLKQKIKSMEIIDNDTQNNILKEINAKILETEKYDQNQLLVMLKNFYEAKSKKDLTCPLEQALEYQKIAEEVYKVSGNPITQS